MDFDAKAEIKRVEQDLEDLDRQISAMDHAVRCYLEDSVRFEYPQYRLLINKIRNYRLAHLTNTHLETLLENLQWKTLYHEKSWNQWWDDAEAHKVNDQRLERYYCAPDGPEFKRKKTVSVDSLWEMQQNKLKEHELEKEVENKAEFKKRLVQDYRKLVKDKTKEQKMVLVFDKERNRCALKLERRKYRR